MILKSVEEKDDEEKEAAAQRGKKNLTFVHDGHVLVGTKPN